MNKFFVFCAYFLFISNICYSWNLKGHQVIAKIAELNIRPGTLEKVSKILQEDTMISTAGRADGESRTARKKTDHWHSIRLSIKNEITL